jgi:hypothetical protein
VDSIAPSRTPAASQDQHLFAKSKRLSNFLVEGEQHYWVHVAIDRFTGQVIDKQMEVVNGITEVEKRYWLHIALGRDLVSGNVDVLGQQLEEVTE